MDTGDGTLLNMIQLNPDEFQAALLAAMCGFNKESDGDLVNYIVLVLSSVGFPVNSLSDFVAVQADPEVAALMSAIQPQVTACVADANAKLKEAALAVLNFATEVTASGGLEATWIPIPTFMENAVSSYIVRYAVCTDAGGSSCGETTEVLDVMSSPYVFSDLVVGSYYKIQIGVVTVGNNNPDFTDLLMTAVIPAGVPAS